MQVFPHRSTPHITAHAGNVVPAANELSEWSFRDVIVHDLTNLYSDSLPSGLTVVDIPKAVKNRKPYRKPNPNPVAVSLMEITVALT